MDRKLTLLFIALFLSNAFGSAVLAQKSSPAEIALEVTFLQGTPPDSQPIAESTADAQWVWYSKFGRIPNFQAPAGSLPVRAVKFIPYLEKDRVKIVVTVFKGQITFDKEEVLAEYSLRENERVKVKELTSLGVVPFEIAVVRVAPSVSVLPTVVNKISSLQVSVEPNYSTLSSYKIRVLNNSSKAVSALTFITTLNKAFQLSGMRQGFQGEPLIKPGEIYEDVIRNTSQPEKNSSEKISAAAPNLILNISTVVFADGTYEGELESAAQFLAFNFGRKSQLNRITSLLEKAAGNDVKIDELDRQLSNLGFQVDETAFNEFLKQFPPVTEKGKTGMRDSAEGAANLVKKTILIDLKTFEAAQKNPEANTLQDWLKATKEKYQNWLARLSVVRQ